MEKKEYRETIFGKEYEVIVYPNDAQHIDHISIIVHPDKAKEIRKKIRK